MTFSPSGVHFVVFQMEFIVKVGHLKLLFCYIVYTFYSEYSPLICDSKFKASSKSNYTIFHTRKWDLNLSYSFFERITIITDFHVPAVTLSTGG